MASIGRDGTEVLPRAIKKSPGARSILADLVRSDDDEDQGLQQAIKDSLGARNPTVLTQINDPAAQDEEAQSPKRRANIEDRIAEMTLQPALELPLVYDSEGDTWIFIDPPPRQPEQDEMDYARYIKRSESPMLVRKEDLLKHSSPDSTVDFDFETLFGPSAQFRITRRRKLTAKLRDSPNIKYVIDLTPPAEGDDAVYLTTELCCSEGVRLWYQAREIWNVSNILVGGNEEYTSVERANSASSYRTQEVCPSAKSPTTIEKSNGKSIGTDGTLLPLRYANILMPLEYSPVRHRSAIERVIAALVGVDPKLDSAPKVWTTFAVAKYLGIKDSPVTDYIIRWLRAYPNSFFLEVCPEVSLRIADGLENHDLARDTFAILVGEEALDSLVRARLPNDNDQYSVFGRRKEDLPEKIYSRIEYASKSFLERINNDFHDFVGEEMQWVDNLPEVRRLSSNAQPDLQGIIVELKALLKAYVRGTIYKLLCVNYDYVPPAEFHCPGGDGLIQRWNRAEVWMRLSVSERILSRTFWHALLSFGIFEGSSNFDISKGWNMDWSNVQSSPEEKRQIRLGTYYKVSMRDLNQCIRRGNTLDVLTQETQTQTATLPDRTRPQAYAVPIGHFAPPTEPYRSCADLQDGQSVPLKTLSDKTDPRLRPPDYSGIRQFPSSIAPRNFQFDFDPTVTAKNRPISPGAAHVEWPFGAPRSPSWADDESEDESGTTGQRASSEQRNVDFLSQSQPVDGRSTPPFFIQPQEDAETWVNKESKKQKTGPAQAMTGFFVLHEFFWQARASIEATARRKLQYADRLMREEPHDIGITNTLVCLQESEWKYLPLWAGGYDDGTGGVFNDQIPAADLGFSTPGPDVHTGTTPANSLRTPSEFSMVDSNFGDDTVNTSMANNRSFSGALHRKRVYAADSMDSASSEDFDMITAEEDPEEENARRKTEAQEQIEAADDKAAREAWRVEESHSRMTDENYADLFNDDEDDDTDRAEDGDSMMDESDEDEETVMV